MSFGNVVLLDSAGKRLDPKLYPKPAGHDEFYYDFSVPLFNRNKDFVYIEVIEYFGKRTRYLYYLFRKNGKVWEKLDDAIDFIESIQMGSVH